MKSTETSIKNHNNLQTHSTKQEKPQKPPFRRAQDDTKPALQDPILISDPIETEEAVLRLPPVPITRPKFQS